MSWSYDQPCAFNIPGFHWAILLQFSAGHNASADSVLVACYCTLCAEPSTEGPQPRVCTFEAWWEHATKRKIEVPDSFSDEVYDKLSADICLGNTSTAGAHGGEKQVRESGEHLCQCTIPVQADVCCSTP